MRCRHGAASWLFAMIVLVFARFCGSADGATGAMLTGGDENTLRRHEWRQNQKSSSYTAPPLPAQLHRHRYRSAGPGSPPPAAARTRRCARDEAAVETW